jgi:hypothetical protein
MRVAEIDAFLLQELLAKLLRLTIEVMRNVD